MQIDPEKHWGTKPFATRLLDGGPDRVTLLSDRLKVQRGGSTTESPVPAEDWDGVLRSWFGLSDVRRAPTLGSGPGS